MTPGPTHAAPSRTPAAAGRHVLLLAGYQGDVQEYFLDPPAALTPGRALPRGELGTNVSWLAFARAHGGARVVYSADEAAPGRVFARRWDADPAAPLLQPLAPAPADVHGAASGGDGPVALALVGSAATHASGPAALVVANYDGGSAALLQLRADGGLDAPAPPPHAPGKDTDRLAVFPFQRAEDAPIGPVSSRQSAAYAHEAVTSPDGAHVYVPDLGTDQVHMLKVQHKLGSRHISAKRGHDTECPPGSGPRHIAFYPPGASTVGGRLGAHGDPSATALPRAQHAYLAQELTCTLQAYSVGSSGCLSALGGPVSAVPPGLALGGTPTAGPQRTTSEVVVSPDGRYVYVGTRGDDDEDHISVFVRHPDGSAAFREWVPSGGKMPRHFSISLDAQAAYLAVANQASSRLTLFARDPQHGSLTRIPEATIDFASVAFAGFAPDA